MREKKDINIEIGVNIRKVREEAGLTQQQISELIDITPQFYSEVERGKSGISHSLMKTICERFCVSADFLIMGKREKNDISPIVEKLKYLSEEELSYVERGIMADIELIAYEKMRKGKTEENTEESIEEKSEK